MAQYDITTASSAFTFRVANSNDHLCVGIDANHFLDIFFDATGTGNSGAQVCAVNTTSFAVTTSSSELTLNSITLGNAGGLSIIDSTHVIMLATAGGLPYAKVLTINTTTWEVTSTSTLVYDTNFNVSFTSNPIQIDTNHFITFWGTSPGSQAGRANVLAVNTTTYAITTASSPFVFDTQSNSGDAAIKIDTNHVLNVYLGGSPQSTLAEVFAINTTTWAVTTTNTRLSFFTGASPDGFMSIIAIDANHFVYFSGRNTDNNFVNAQVLTVNTSTWAVTTASSVLTFSTQVGITGTKLNCVKIDTNHFGIIWNAGSSFANLIGYLQIFTVNTSTFAITTTNAQYSYGSRITTASMTTIDTTHTIAFGRSSSIAQVFKIEGAPLGPANLKSYNTNLKANIKTINTNPIANVKTLDTNA